MDMERELACRIADLKSNNTPAYLAMIAVLDAMAGYGSKPEGFTRGDFKRAIKAIRETPKGREFAPTVEAAVTLIREDWLGRTAKEERGTTE